eukprot:NODE_284_length_1963_cov_8.400209_g237_i0.p1 GENE.NODE_284_length_1963_cov_8.400209_g237_i0~~NODE_284_length_1963_cov_8.400209_g237_i0.p1  ORF type:complete len:258 (-),score=65.67 NODE_284_length_1963_cov_8.400209_g237_i0:725-1498(-)
MAFQWFEGDVNLFGGSERPDKAFFGMDFRDFGSSLLLLYQAATMKAWNRVMYEARGCVGGCTNPILALYFLAFMIACFVLLNLLLTVVVENYHEAGRTLTNDQLLQPFCYLREGWSELDPKATERLDAITAAALLWRQHAPFGPYAALVDTTPFLHLLKYSCELDLAVDDDNCVKYVDVMHVMAARLFGASKKEMACDGGSGYRMHHVLSACRIQTAWRSRRTGLEHELSNSASPLPIHLHAATYTNPLVLQLRKNT